MRHLRAILLMSAILASSLPPAAHAAGSLVKASGPAVYYVDEGKRYVFPNEKVYFSWYQDFSGVTTIGDADLAAYPIGGNVTYRPGVRMIKIQSDPKVYAVAAGGALRWITSEDAARSLFGDDWNRQVHDLSDAFFFNYRISDPIASAADFDRDAERSIGSITADLAMRGGVVSAGDFTAVKSGAWSDHTVWGGKQPTVGSRVVIPPNIRVIYDPAESPTLKTLDVLGTLEFTTLRSTKLASRAINVRGKIVVGTEETPMPEAVTAEILLSGSASTAVTDDGLHVDGGTLELHGSPVAVVWARLSAPAAAGDGVIKLDRASGWKPGASVVIASTSPDPNEAETRVITAVEGAILTLDKPLVHSHRAEERLAAEVGLLSRNVIVSGMGDGLGSHVTVLNRGTLKASDAEFRHLGRMGAYGQYPIFLDGAASSSYLKTSTIHESGNRCVSLRQMTGASLTGNVASGIYGHCFSFEDGVETGNVLKDNLVVDVRVGAMDPAPAGFLLRHPGNEIEGNTVAGSAAFGYWYLLADKVTRSDGTTVRPREAELKAFRTNAVRSARRVGLYVDDNDKGRANFIPPAKAVFTGLTATMSGERGFWIRGTGVEVSGAMLVENRIGGTFAAFGATFRDSTVIGRLPGSAAASLPGAGGRRYGFTFLDGPISVIGVTFSDLEGDKESAFGFEEKNAGLPDYRNSYRSATFLRARPWSAVPPETAGDKLAVARDTDAGVTVTADSPFLEASCERDVAAGIRRCPARYGQLTVALRDSAGDRSVIFANLSNSASVTLSPGGAFDGEYAYVTVAEGGAYKATLPAVTDLLVEYEAASLPVTLRLPVGPNVRVRSFGTDIPQGDADGQWSYDSAKSEAVLRLTPGASWDVEW